MNMYMKFGQTELPLRIDDDRDFTVFAPQNIMAAKLSNLNTSRLIIRSISKSSLSSYNLKNKKIVLIVNGLDSNFFIRNIFDTAFKMLTEAGASFADITVVFSKQLCQTCDRSELLFLLGSYIEEGVICTDICDDDFVYMGTTDAGTPVEVFSPIANADFRICIDRITYDNICGYTGGLQTLISSAVTEKSKLTCYSNTNIAPPFNYDKITKDIECVAKLCPIDFAINIVANHNNEIINCFSAEPFTVQKQGFGYFDSIYKFKADKQFDIVVVSAGGFPYDSSFSASYGALTNVLDAVKKGGIIVFVSESPGFGDKETQLTLLGHSSADDLAALAAKNFSLANHIGASIGTVLQKSAVFNVSLIPHSMSTQIFFDPFRSLHEAINAALAINNGKGNYNMSIAVVPYGNCTRIVL